MTTSSSRTGSQHVALAPAPGTREGAPPGTVRAGWIGVAGGLLGAVQAAIVLVWPAQVGPERFSHPFDADGWVVAQLSFALQHLLLLVLVLGLGRFAWHPRSWLTRSGIVVTAAGLVLLTGCEVFALTAASAPVGSPVATAVESSYGLPMAVLGVGLLLAGVGSARRGPLRGWARWVPLVLGVYVFAVMVPAVFGTDLAGRLAIGGWMLLFAVLGRALVRAARDAGVP